MLCNLRFVICDYLRFAIICNLEFVILQPVASWIARTIESRMEN